MAPHRRNNPSPTPRDAYQFSDFPWPPTVKEDFPSSAQVRDYLHSYAEHFSLLRYIKFNFKVVAMDYVGPSEKEMGAWEEWGGTGEAFKSGGKWHITVEEGGDKKSAELSSVDFLLLSNESPRSSGLACCFSYLL